MELFKLECLTCRHTWTDINKTYMCPKCDSKTVAIKDSRKEGIFTESGQGNVLMTVWVVFMLFLVILITTLANKVLLP